VREKLNRDAIGQRLKALRGEDTQNNVATALGITAAAVSQYERGERVPNDDLKIAYAKLYGKTVDEIFFTAK